MRDLNQAAPLVGGFNRFGFRLYRELPKDGNCFYSPVSIAAVLSALLVGARGNTFAELASLLEIEDNSDAFPDRFAALLATLLERRSVDWEVQEPGGELARVEADLFTLRLANALFVNSAYPCRTAYRDVLEEAFHADLITLDFGRPEEASLRINQWVSERTEERINQIVYREHIISTTRMILANAVYFLAQWEHPFDEAHTRREPFHLSSDTGGDTVDVPMMYQTLQLSHMTDPRGFQAVSIPYRALSMIVLLPEPGRFDVVDEILTADTVDEVVSHFRSCEVTLGLPRFEISSGYELLRALGSLGLGDALDIGRADFSGISDDPSGLFLSQVLHAARIRVDEAGTEAVAATVARMTLGMAPPSREPQSFIADRPFFFCIRDDQTKAILFTGRVTDPLH